MKFSSLLVVPAAALMLLLGGARRADAVAVATLDMQDNPTIMGNTATIDVFLTFESDNPADRIQSIELSLFDSDLTSGNMNFGRYGFNLALPGWSEFDPIGGGAFPGIGIYDSAFDMTTPLAPQMSPYLVGTLEVDLTGLPPDTTFDVLLNGGVAPDTITDIGGLVDGMFVAFADVSTNGDPAQILFGDPQGVQITTPPGTGGPIIPEPATAIWLPALATMMWRRRRARA